MSRSHPYRHPYIPAVKVSALAVCLAMAGSAGAVQLQFDNGMTGTFDTTISAGVSVRTQDVNGTLVGIANGGSSRSVNGDDGDRAYHKNRPFSELLKATHDLELKYEGWGLFARGLYFIDFKNRSNDALGPIGKDRLGQDALMLDAFISKSFTIADRTARLRVGKQVISWGESTFIPNGINIVNAVDISKLRVPGSEVKEGLIPTMSALASIELTKNASLEVYSLFNFDKVKIDPKGSYFSNNDIASDDASQAFVAFGRRKDLTGRTATNPIPPTIPGVGALATSLYGPFDPAAAVWVRRTDDRNPKDSGQYGVALRYLATELNNTEFALYYQNYHSRVPFLSGVKGTVTSVLTGGPLGGPVGHTGTATYFAEYPENIKLYGVSFNTAGPAGVALQGEFSFRPNQPLQLSGTELILALLSAPNVITGYQTIPGTVSATAPFGASPAALVPNGTELTGWRRVNMSQFQMTATKLFPNVVKADQAALAGEVGFTKYNLPGGGLLFDGPGTSLAATSQGAVAGQAGSVQPGGYVTTNSWGYRVSGRLDYTNSLFGGNLSPRVAFSHDVRGVSQTFTEGVKSVSVGANLEFQKKLTFDVSYTNFFGGKVFCGTDQITNAGQTALGAQLAGVAALGVAPQRASWCTSTNSIKDRDFVSFVVSYSF